MVMYSNRPIRIGGRFGLMGKEIMVPNVPERRSRY